MKQPRLTSEQLTARLDEVLSEIDALKAKRGELKLQMAEGDAKASRAALAKVATEIVAAEAEGQALEDAIELAQRREAEEARREERKRARLHLDAARVEVEKATGAWRRVDQGVDAFVELVVAALGHHRVCERHLHAAGLLWTARNPNGVDIDLSPIGRQLVANLVHRLVKSNMPGVNPGWAPEIGRHQAADAAAYIERKVFEATAADPEPKEEMA